MELAIAMPFDRNMPLLNGNASHPTPAQIAKSESKLTASQTKVWVLPRDW